MSLTKVSKQDLRNLRVVDLKNISRDCKIQGYSLLRKDKLVELIYSHRNKDCINKEYQKIIKLKPKTPKPITRSKTPKPAKVTKTSKSIRRSKTPKSVTRPKKEYQNKITIPDLEDIQFKDLKNIAKSCHIKGYSNMTQGELIRHLLSQPNQSCIETEYSNLTGESLSPLEYDNSSIQYTNQELILKLGDLDRHELIKISNLCGQKQKSNASKNKVLSDLKIMVYTQKECIINNYQLVTDMRSLSKGPFSNDITHTSDLTFKNHPNIEIGYLGMVYPTYGDEYKFKVTNISDDGRTINTTMGNIIKWNQLTRKWDNYRNGLKGQYDHVVFGSKTQYPKSPYSK